MMAAARRLRAGCAYFLAEKGIDVPKVAVDLAKLEQKSESFRALNPLQRVPVLVLDDGTVIAETMAICRYFEALPSGAEPVRPRCDRDRKSGNVEPPHRVGTL